MRRVCAPRVPVRALTRRSCRHQDPLVAAAMHARPVEGFGAPGDLNVRRRAAALIVTHRVADLSSLTLTVRWCQPVA